MPVDAAGVEACPVAMPKPDWLVDVVDFEAGTV